MRKFLVILPLYYRRLIELRRNLLNKIYTICLQQIPKLSYEDYQQLEQQIVDIEFHGNTLYWKMEDDSTIIINNKVVSQLNNGQLTQLRQDKYKDFLEVLSAIPYYEWPEILHEQNLPIHLFILSFLMNNLSPIIDIWNNFEKN